MELNPEINNIEFLDSDGEFTIYYGIVYIGNVKLVNMDKYINYLKKIDIDTRYIRFYKDKLQQFKNILII